MVGTLSDSSAEEWEYNLYAVGRGTRLAISFTAQPYSTEIVSLVGWDAKKCSDFLARKFAIEFEFKSHQAACALSFITEKGLHYVVVICPSKPTTVESIAELVHECVHAASYVFNHAGAIHDLENEEPYSYLVQKIVQTCLGGYHVRNRKRRKKASS